MRIALGERHIARQIEIIADFERAGYPTWLAIDLLTTYRDLQAMHITHRDRIRQALEP